MTIPPYQPPPHEERNIANGSRLFVFDFGSSDYAEIRISIPLTRFSEKDTVLSTLLSSIVDSETYHNKDFTINQALLKLGAKLDIFSMTDRVLLIGSAPIQNLSIFMNLVSCVFELSPTSASLETAKQLTLFRTQSLVKDARLLLTSKLMTYMWGNHPLSRYVSEPSVIQEIDQRTFEHFSRERFGMYGAVIVVVGNFLGNNLHLSSTCDQLAVELQSWYAGNKVDHMPSAPIAPTRRKYTGREIINPNSVHLQYMNRAPMRTDPSYAYFLLASTVLCGYSRSRIGSMLRDENGVIYDVKSHMDDFRGGSAHSLLLTTSTKEYRNVKIYLKNQLDHFYEKGITQKELHDSKCYVLNSPIVFLDNESSLASTVVSLLAVESDMNYWNDLFYCAKDASLASVHCAIKQYFDPDLYLYGTEWV